MFQVHARLHTEPGEKCVFMDRYRENMLVLRDQNGVPTSFAFDQVIDEHVSDIEAFPMFGGMFTEGKNNCVFLSFGENSSVISVVSFVCDLLLAQDCSISMSFVESRRGRLIDLLDCREVKSSLQTKKHRIQDKESLEQILGKGLHNAHEEGAALCYFFFIEYPNKVQRFMVFVSFPPPLKAYDVHSLSKATDRSEINLWSMRSEQRIFHLLRTLRFQGYVKDTEQAGLGGLLQPFLDIRASISLVFHLKPHKRHRFINRFHLETSRQFFRARLPQALKSQVAVPRNQMAEIARLQLELERSQDIIQKLNTKLLSQTLLNTLGDVEINSDFTQQFSGKLKEIEERFTQVQKQNAAILKSVDTVERKSANEEQPQPWKQPRFKYEDETFALQKLWHDYGLHYIQWLEFSLKTELHFTLRNSLPHLNDLEVLDLQESIWKKCTREDFYRIVQKDGGTLQRCLNNIDLRGTEIKFSTLAAQPLGMLEVHVIQAEGIAAMDRMSLSDPFVRVRVHPYSRQTDVVEDADSVLWNQTFLFEVSDLNVNVQIDLRDKDKLSTERILGVQIPLLDIIENKAQTFFSSEKGSLQVGYIWVDYGEENLIDIQEFCGESVTQFGMDDRCFQRALQRLNVGFNPTVARHVFEVISHAEANPTLHLDELLFRLRCCNLSDKVRLKELRMLFFILADIPWQINIACEDPDIGPKIDGSYTVRTVLCQGRPMWSSLEGSTYLWWNKDKWIISEVFNDSEPYCFLEIDDNEPESYLGRRILNSKRIWKNVKKNRYSKDTIKEVQVYINHH